jgi:hypothetical protein
MCIRRIAAGVVRFRAPPVQAEARNADGNVSAAVERTLWKAARIG